MWNSFATVGTTPQRPIWNSFATVGVRDFWENCCSWLVHVEQAHRSPARGPARVRRWPEKWALAPWTQRRAMDVQSEESRWVTGKRPAGQTARRRALSYLQKAAVCCRHVHCRVMSEIFCNSTCPSTWAWTSAANACTLSPRRRCCADFRVILQYSRHVRAIPWPWGRRRARRRIDTGRAGRLHGRERARGHVQPRCRGGGGVGRGKGCRHRHRSGGRPPAWRNAHGRGRHPAAQRTCARRAGRPTRRTGGWVGPTTARRGASNLAARWRQQPPTRRRNRSRRAGTISRESSWALRTPAVAARGRRAQLGAVGGGRGAGAVRALWPMCRDSPSQPRNSIRFQHHRDPCNTDTPSDPWGHECRLPPLKRRASPLI